MFAISKAKHILMKKIHILKAIIDFVWILSVALIPLIIIFIPFLFIYDLGDLDLAINNIALPTLTTFGKILMSTILLSYLLLIYCLFLFRKIMELFSRGKIFSETVLINLNKIGNFLVLFAIINIGVPFIQNLSFGKIHVDFVLSPFIMALSIGLFFMVLSEIFKIAKTAKTENDLTI